MKILIVCVGKIKEEYYKKLIDEYMKNIMWKNKIQIIEVADEKTVDKASSYEEDIVKEIEGLRILKQIKENTYVIALDIRGKQLNSQEFALKIQNVWKMGKEEVAFIIGGSLGLHQSVLSRAEYKISFSNMTFPHQLMRVILLEQLDKMP